MAPPPGPDCFCAGVRLMTLRGEIPVETLRIGDRVLTLSGNGTPLKPVTAIDEIAVDLDRHAQPLLAAPVRIRADAFEPGMPIRDLLLSPDHAVSVEDDTGRRVLIPALNLVNGATILREPPAGRISYFQVAVEAHDILMADGLAVESAPAAAAVVPFAPRGTVPAEPDFTPRGREATGCAPYVWGSAARPVHARLLQRAHELGHSLTDDPALTVLVGATTLAALSEADGEYVYLLPPDTQTIRLMSRSRVPAEIDPAGGDTRRLGVALARVLIDGTELPMDDPAFGLGFLPAEGDGERWRWTNGEAELAMTPQRADITLELHVHAGWSRYWK